MNFGLKQTLMAGTVLAVGGLAGVVGVPTSAQAGTCPTITDNIGAGTHQPAGTTSDCNVLLTLNATTGGGFSVTPSNPSGKANYDGSDDNYIGIFNNTGHALAGSFNISGPAVTHYGGIFGGMDGDGICDTARFSGATCGTGVTTGPGIAGAPGAFNYAPSGVTLDALTTNSGIVSFAGGLAAGQIGVFSLEEPASTNGIIITPTPEPATLSLIGVALAGLGVARRRRRKAA